MIVACFDGGNASFYLDAPNKEVEKEVVFKKPRKNRRNTEEEVKKALEKWEEIKPIVTSLYTAFFFEEFIPAIDSFYRTDSNNRAITGFSMGGFGSMHYMLEKPQMFKSISGLSSAFYTEERIQQRAGRKNNYFARLLGDYNTNKD